MFKYILLCTLLAHTMWAKPVHEHTDLAPHVLIVTPQAQVRLDSLIPGTPIIQHLTPVTRFIAPHEETIVYVPASAAAAAPVQYTEVIARASPSNVAKQDLAEQLTQIAQGAAQAAAQNAGSLISGTFAPGDLDPANALQGALGNALSQAAAAATNTAAAAGSSLIAGASSFSPGDWPNSLAPLVQGALTNTPNALGTAANAAANAAQAAGTSFVTGLTQTGPSKSPSSLEPLPLPAPALSSSSDLPLLSLPKLDKLQYEIPITPIVLSDPRHHYIIAPAPAVPHVVDFVQSPILLAPALNTIKARNLESEDPEQPIVTIPFPEYGKPDTLPLKYAREKEELIKEKKAELKRFLEASALKDEAQLLDQKNQIKTPVNQKNEKLALDTPQLELKPAPIIDEEKDEKPQSKVA